MSLDKEDIVKNDLALRNEIYQHIEDNEKKDKIIDLMAEFIKNNMSEKKLIKEICLKGKCNNEECHEDDWNNCIKQYFERKATNNG